MAPKRQPSLTSVCFLRRDKENQHTNFIQGSHGTLHGRVAIRCSEDGVERLCANDTAHDTLCRKKLVHDLVFTCQYATQATYGHNRREESPKLQWSRWTMTTFCRTCRRTEERPLRGWRRQLVSSSNICSSRIYTCSSILFFLLLCPPRTSPGSGKDVNTREEKTREDRQCDEMQGDEKKCGGRRRSLSRHACPSAPSPHFHPHPQLFPSPEQESTVSGTPRDTWRASCLQKIALSSSLLESLHTM